MLGGHAGWEPLRERRCREQEKREDGGEGPCCHGHDAAIIATRYEEIFGVREKVTV
jgi:hypothetical protein